MRVFQQPVNVVFTLKNTSNGVLNLLGLLGISAALLSDERQSFFPVTTIIFPVFDVTTKGVFRPVLLFLASAC